MKKTSPKSFLARFSVACLVVILPLSAILSIGSGCKSVSQVDPVTGFTNTVTVIDTNKLALAEQSLQTIGSAVFIKAIKNSPQHSVQIANFVRAIGNTFCQVHARRQFSPATVFPALEAATAQFQIGVPEEVIITKNGIKTIYQILWNDHLTISVPDGKWPAAVCQVICRVINQSLLDAGLPGTSVFIHQPVPTPVP